MKKNTKIFSDFIKLPAVHNSYILTVDQNLTGIRFVETRQQAVGVFHERRNVQKKQWLKLRLAAQLQARFFNNPNVQSALQSAESAFLNGDMSLDEAINQILDAG